jgi:hypothetical protein
LLPYSFLAVVLLPDIALAALQLLIIEKHLQANIKIDPGEKLAQLTNRTVCLSALLSSFNIKVRVDYYPDFDVIGNNNAFTVGFGLYRV